MRNGTEVRMMKENASGGLTKSAYICIARRVGHLLTVREQYVKCLWLAIVWIDSDFRIFVLTWGNWCSLRGAGRGLQVLKGFSSWGLFTRYGFGMFLNFPHCLIWRPCQ